MIFLRGKSMFLLITFSLIYTHMFSVRVLQDEPMLDTGYAAPGRYIDRSLHGMVFAYAQKDGEKVSSFFYSSSSANLGLLKVILYDDIDFPYRLIWGFTVVESTGYSHEDTDEIKTMFHPVNSETDAISIGNFFLRKILKKKRREYNSSDSIEDLKRRTNELRNNKKIDW